MSRTLYKHESPAYLCHMPMTQMQDRGNGSHTPRLRLRWDRIRTLARRKGAVTVPELARLFGLSRQHMYLLIRGVHLPSAETTLRMAAALEIPVDDLWDRQ